MAVNMVILGEDDNVGIALADIAADAEAASIAGVRLTALEPIPQGHKIALRAIAAGEDVVRFGVPVAIARAEIGRGRLVHVHNVASRYLDNDEDHYE